MITTFRASGIFRFATAIVLMVLAMPLAVVAQERQAAPIALTTMTAEDAIAAATESGGVLRFDVSEDAGMFVWDPDVAHDDGMPAYGTPFITRAYIYPAGTLTESNGVNPDGSPEFPDQVLGEWICRGWFVGDGMRTTTGPMVVTSQVYNFCDGFGEAMIVTDGYELADVGVEIERAVTGGTGPFLGASGVARQTLLGLNATEGVNLRYEIELVGSGL
jgi:hypothetical protein